jgi:hypothetical protein
MPMEDKLMHDWTLKDIEVMWKSGTVRVDLICRPGVIKSLTALDLVELAVPRRQEWGPSESIMSHEGPLRRPDGRQQLQILMQSGDSIVIIAGEIAMPSGD